MAIINSAGIGKSSKSQGNLTYKYVRGRTIASSRITENKSNTPKQSIARMNFAALSHFVTRFASYINAAFDKSKYGSPRNAFMTVNKSLLTQSAYLNAINNGTQKLYNLFEGTFGTPTSDVFPYVCFGAAPSVFKGSLVTEKSYYTSVTFDFATGVAFSSLTFGCLQASANAETFFAPRAFEDALDDLEVGSIKYTLTYADTEKTIVTKVVCASTDFATGYLIPIMCVGNKVCKLDKPLFK